MLYITGTPIGNLEDITLRQLRILGEVDLIAAEDTRHSLKLLTYYNIKTKFVSYHANSSYEKTLHLLQILEEGKQIALITDCGMPLISDPGSKLVNLAYEKGIKVTTVPGPTAFVSGLVLSTLSTSKFIFEGFFPVKKHSVLINSLKTETRTVCFYEAPHRLIKTLNILKELGDRKISIIREITKLYEEALLFSSAEEAILHFNINKPKGEFVIVIEGRETESIFNNTLEDHVEELIFEGYSKKDAIKQVAKLRSLPKSEVYKYINIL